MEQAQTSPKDRAPVIEIQLFIVMKNTEMSAKHEHWFTMSCVSRTVQIQLHMKSRLSGLSVVDFNVFQLWLISCLRDLKLVLIKAERSDKLPKK